MEIKWSNGKKKTNNLSSLSCLSLHHLWTTVAFTTSIAQIKTTATFTTSTRPHKFLSAAASPPSKAIDPSHQAIQVSFQICKFYSVLSQNQRHKSLHWPLMQNPRIWPPSSAPNATMHNLNFDHWSMCCHCWLWLWIQQLWHEGLLLLLFLKAQISYFLVIRSFYFHVSLIYFKMGGNYKFLNWRWSSP